MKKVIFLILICSTTAAFEQKGNFSGTWRLDTTRTTFGTGPHWTIPKSITVDQQSAQLVLTRVNINANMLEQPPVTETLAFDGTPFQFTIGDTHVATTLHWLNDSSIILNRIGNVIATETWMMEKGGKTLVIDRSVEQKSNGFKYTIKGYYDKE